MWTLAAYLVYPLPLYVRIWQSWDSATPPGVVAALLPFGALALSAAGPRLYKGEENYAREHVFRHALFAGGFVVAAAFNVKWAAAPPALLWYVAMGALSLAWFSVSHLIEMRYDAPRTHVGDIVVLPFGMMTTALVHMLWCTDACYRFLHTAVYVIPVYVGWNTLFFIGLYGFARDNVTMYHRTGFARTSTHASIVAAVCCCALEVRAPPWVWTALPLLLALYIQALPWKQV